jgi:hypothetical protein
MRQRRLVSPQAGGRAWADGRTPSDRFRKPKAIRRSSCDHGRTARSHRSVAAPDCGARRCCDPPRDPLRTPAPHAPGRLFDAPAGTRQRGRSPHCRLCWPPAMGPSSAMARPRGAAHPGATDPDRGRSAATTHCPTGPDPAPQHLPPQRPLPQCAVPHYDGPADAARSCGPLRAAPALTSPGGSRVPPQHPPLGSANAAA